MALTIIACVHPTACAVGYDLALLRSLARDTQPRPKPESRFDASGFEALNGALKNINRLRPGLALLGK